MTEESWWCRGWETKVPLVVSLSNHGGTGKVFFVIARPFVEGRGNLIIITGVYLIDEIATSPRQNRGSSR